MSLRANLIGLGERLPLPDTVTRFAIDRFVAGARRQYSRVPPGAEAAFARDLTAHAIAEHADLANRQHYELPPAFFAAVLGPQRKYSSCLYLNGDESLAEAETAALEATASHAALANGQRILELGCGWGSLTLFMAARFPAATITAVSNSRPQREHILATAAARGIDNIEVITADMNVFVPPRTYDRVVSVEMFEHMSNWRELLGRIRNWLTADGRVFMHVFTHRTTSYRFDAADEADWIGKHFFTGGIMPGQTLIRQFSDIFAVSDEWRWSGTHYCRTANDWLRNFDARRAEIDPILHNVYGEEAALWRRRWRLFFLATAGLFGFDDGKQWGVSHYLLRPA